MGKLLELLEKLVRAIFGPGDERDTGRAIPAPAGPQAEGGTRRGGDPEPEGVGEGKGVGLRGGRGN